MKTMPIKIIITGGTFDKKYDEITGKLYFKKTHVLGMLKLGRCLLDIQIRTVIMIDA